MKELYNRVECRCGEMLQEVNTSRTWEVAGKYFSISHIPGLKCTSDDCNGEFIDKAVEIRVALIMEIMEEQEIYEIDYGSTTDNP